MKLTLKVQRSEHETALRVEGETLIIDGERIDLSGVPEGGEARVKGDLIEEGPEGPIYAQTQFRGPIRRVDGQLHVTLLVRLGPDAAPVQDDPFVVDATEGVVVIPAARIEQEPT